MENNGDMEIEVNETPPREPGAPDEEFVRKLIELGQPLKVKLGEYARQDEVTLADGTPIRGIVNVTIEDDVQTGRVVILRIRNAEVVGEPFDVVLQSPDDTDAG